MDYDIIAVKYLGDYKLEILFGNKKKGIVDLKDYIEKENIFSRFSDIEYFKKYYIDEETKVLCWPGGLDIAPETIYCKATGEPLPEWMEKEQDKIPEKAAV